MRHCFKLRFNIETQNNEIPYLQKRGTPASDQDIPASSGFRAFIISTAELGTAFALEVTTHRSITLTTFSYLVIWSPK
ncbi:hypothetical protein EGK70_005315 [Alcaligenes aquatilis]|uniref:hypothetical protein n=1 Tax=Alcaligenes aquatilis TaxID=323284 RepID=UPI000F65D4E1|nr:hypothetical protein [Alcaligenes aquatilis]QXR36936.1 hypothetical protein EGK70_005315 [Alcaligenes aquatilis]